MKRTTTITAEVQDIGFAMNGKITVDIEFTFSSKIDNKRRNFHKVIILEQKDFDHN